MNIANYEKKFQSLTPTQTAYLSAALKTTATSGDQLFNFAVAKKLDQATVVLSIISATDEIGMHLIEVLTDIPRNTWRVVPKAKEEEAA